MNKLIDQVEEVLRCGDDNSRVLNCMREYATSKADDWKEYAFFCQHNYTRNLIFSNENFEVILLCWSAGQESPIHDHSGQRCWMSVLQGGVEETYYYQTNDTSLIKGNIHLHCQGEASFIADEIALHKIRPAFGSAVTLHIYSKPIERSSIYSPTTGSITQHQAGFFSKYGRKMNDVQA